MKNKILLPCPFCGGTDVEISYTKDKHILDTGSYQKRNDAHIWCNNYACEGIDVYADTKEDVIKLWNRRAECKKAHMPNFYWGRDTHE